MYFGERSAAFSVSTDVVFKIKSKLSRSFSCSSLFCPTCSVWGRCLCSGGMFPTWWYFLRGGLGCRSADIDCSFTQGQTGADVNGWPTHKLRRSVEDKRQHRKWPKYWSDWLPLTGLFSFPHIVFKLFASDWFQLWDVWVFFLLVCFGAWMSSCRVK